MFLYSLKFAHWPWGQKWNEGKYFLVNSNFQSSLIKSESLFNVWVVFFLSQSPSISLGRVSPPGEESESRASPPRLSPNSLERKFYLELNQLESMEESMRQLTGMERTRAVSMAQQESVSLAQMLKVKCCYVGMFRSQACCLPDPELLLV